ncbi:MAG: O-antigen ligase family protein, partial [Bacteroidia bacterium]|nr:O-antigen ligase family protein [Bacteroidia bacterium]
IGKSSVNENDIVKASVYCYVSKDFNGTWAILYASDAAIGQCNYDLKNKGKWQKLSINIKCKKGEAFGFLYFSKFGVKDFSSLKGYVIFAYPKIEIIKYNNNNSSSFNDNLSRKDNRNLFLNRNSLKNRKINEIYSFISLIDWSNHSKYTISGFFYSSLFFEKNSDSTITDKDPIRNWAAKFISEDTTYFPYKANIVVDTISNSFIDPRISRWEFAVQIFLKEYNWKQKIFGGGFNFLNWYGYYFDKEKTRSDYPHNPFLSILLYSGIFGLILYIIFMFKVFFYYTIYFKEYKILSVFFIITFFFSFFSSGSPFDPPMMGFFVILPFFIHSIHRISKPELK